MPVFNYTALRNGKESVNGKLEARSVKEAREILRKMNFIPTKIQIDVQEIPLLEEEKDKDKDKKESVIKNVKKVKLRKLKHREQLDFTYTLYILAKTGVPLIEAFVFMENNSISKRVQAVAAEIRRLIIAGASLSDAIAMYPEIFGRVYTGLVQTGEESGDLDATLERLHGLLEKQGKLASKVKSTMVYPAFVVFIAIVVSLIMLIFVFPAFKDLYDNMGSELPFITQVCMSIGLFLKKYWFVIPLGAASLTYFTIFIFKWPVSRRIIDTISLKIPVFNNFVKFAALSNFIAVLKISYNAGIPIVDCLLLSNITVNNYPLRDALRTTAIKVQNGMHFSTALKSVNILPQIILFMIATGEQAGKLGEMLEQASEYIDDNLEKIIVNLTSLVEPLLMIVIGVIVLVMALALYLPLFQSYQNMM
ncbi:MAG: type II secretion system F family protein [Candidatus Gastranaerophilales bacterium]|nr:type II secretion system F family protein [Candidatus Gastranaerophilales bacterium]